MVQNSTALRLDFAARRSADARYSDTELSIAR